MSGTSPVLRSTTRNLCREELAKGAEAALDPDRLANLVEDRWHPPLSLSSIPCHVENGGELEMKAVRLRDGRTTKIQDTTLALLTDFGACNLTVT